MTAAETQELKTKIHKVMLDHLTEIGYPDIENEEILRQLKPMWAKLEEAGLIVEGMTYQAFEAHANAQFLLAEVEGIMSI